MADEHERVDARAKEIDGFNFALWLRSFLLLGLELAEEWTEVSAENEDDTSEPNFLMLRIIFGRPLTTGPSFPKDCQEFRFSIPLTWFVEPQS